MDNTAQEAERMGVLARQTRGNGLAPIVPPALERPRTARPIRILVVHGTPGHIDGPGNLTIASIAIRDAYAGTGIPSLRAARSGG